MLFTCENPTDSYFISLIESTKKHAEEEKTRLELMWDRTNSYLDSNFREELGHHFHQRVWEMRLCDDMLQMGLNLTPTNGEGPDFLIDDAGQKIWIEAYAPTKGIAEDAVPDVQYGVAQNVPEDNMKLRYCSGIDSKYTNCYKKHLESGLIDSNDYFIIAVNGCLLEHPDSRDSFPLIVKGLYGIGHESHVYNQSNKQLEYCVYTRKSTIQRTSGSDVNLQTFLTETYPGLSGVLFSEYTLNKPISTHPIEEYIYVSNFTAIKQVDVNIFGDILHFFVKDGQLIPIRAS